MVFLLTPKPSEGLKAAGVGFFRLSHVVRTFEKVSTILGTHSYAVKRLKSSQCQKL